jgi:hypothetical protein
LTEAEWLAENINFLSSKHRFYTNEASSIWDNGKGKNLSRLLKVQKNIARKLKIKTEKSGIKIKLNYLNVA